MRGVVGALVVLATAAVGVPAASAGTYDVVSCGAPGAARRQPRVAAGQSTVLHDSARQLRRRMIKLAYALAGNCAGPTAARGSSSTEPAMRRSLRNGRELGSSTRLPARASRGSTTLAVRRRPAGRRRSEQPRQRVRALRDQRHLWRRRLRARRAMPSGRRRLRRTARCTIGAPSAARSAATPVVQRRVAPSTSFNDRDLLRRVVRRAPSSACYTNDGTGGRVRLHRSSGRAWCTSTDTDRAERSRSAGRCISPGWRKAS